MTARGRPQAGRVLQGYFRVESFRGAGRQGRTTTVVPPPWPGRRDPDSAPPRPDLLAAKMLGAAAQLRLASTAGPRRVLPGMGRAAVSDPPRVGQARSSPTLSTLLAPGQLRVIGAGRPLEPTTRQVMEEFFHADFSGVRVHEGTTASSIGALAFTLGDELHFAPGLYDPTSREGIELLGHELTHVVQQREGRVANPYGQGVAIVQDPALEADADRMGQRVAELWARRCARPLAAGIDRRPPRVINPSSVPRPPAPSILARWDGRAWPIAQPASAKQTASESKQSTSTVTPVAGAGSTADQGWTTMVSRSDTTKAKKAAAFDKIQDEKVAAKARTLCLGALGDYVVEAASAKMRESDYNLISKYLPEMFAHLKKTNNVPKRTAFECAEVNAVVALLHMVQTTKDFVLDPGQIRISQSFDEATGKWKGPCANCSTWLESTDGSMDWLVGDRIYQAWEYQLVAKVLPS